MAELQTSTQATPSESMILSDHLVQNWDRKVANQNYRLRTNRKRLRLAKPANHVSTLATNPKSNNLTNQHFVGQLTSFLTIKTNTHNEVRLQSS